jgi:hypothetical protein
MPVTGTITAYGRFTGAIRRLVERRRLLTAAAAVVARAGLVLEGWRSLFPGATSTAAGGLAAENHRAAGAGLPANSPAAVALERRGESVPVLLVTATAGAGGIRHRPPASSSSIIPTFSIAGAIPSPTAEATRSSSSSNRLF